MTYKNRLIFLLSVIGVLVFLLAGNIIFTSGIAARQDRYVWLDAQTSRTANRIVINMTGFDEDEYELVRRDDRWFVLYNENILPARQLRVQDFFRTLAARGEWIVRSTSAATHERFGLADIVADGVTNRASRIRVYRENAVLLDMLIGANDPMRREAYFRRYGSNEVRSGDNIIRTYLGMANSWFNLRLFPETEGGQVDITNVQRVRVYTPYENQVFARSNRGWVVSGIDVENPDVFTIENYIRSILNTEAAGFANVDLENAVTWEELNHSRIIVEFGDGRTVTITLSAPDEETGALFAHVSGAAFGSFYYSISAWSAGRLFMEAANFEMQGLSAK